MLRLALAAFAALIATCVIAIDVAHAGPVDLFEDGPFQLLASDTPDTASQSGLAPASVLGGRRDVALTNAGLGPPAQATAQLTTTAGVDALTAGTQNNGAIRLQLDYGQGGALNADLSNDNSVSLFFDQLPLFAGFEAQIESGAGSGTVSLSNVDFPQSGVAPGEVRFDFDAAGFANVDFGDVDTMRFTIITDYSDRFALAQIETSSPVTAIPLPPALVPGAATLTALLLLQHVRRRQPA